jgi:peptide/nickel transport system substrate-binding protein
MARDDHSPFDELTRAVMNGRVTRRAVLQRSALLGLGAPVVATLLAACGDDDDEPTPAPGAEPTATPAAEETPAETDPTPTPEAAAPGEPSEVVIAQSADPTTLDPHDHRETPTGVVVRHIYDPLFERSADDPSQMNPVLAESWEMNSDTELEIRIKSGVQFHNGEAFTADVVKYNIDRVTMQLPGQEQETLNAYQFGPIASAEVIDETTVRVTTSEPDPLLLGRLAALQMVPMEYTQDGFDVLDQQPVGTGPYTFVSWVPNDRLIVEANPDYHMGAPEIDRVVFRPIPEGATRIAELRAGNVDVIVNLPPDNIPEVENSPNAQVRSVPSARVAMVFLNTLEYEFLADTRVRQALNYAVDVEAIITNLMDGYATRVATVVPPYFTGYNPDLEPYPYDPDRARELLAEAGYEGGGFSVELLVPHGRYQQGVEAAQAIAGYLQEVGIDSTIDAVEFGHFAAVTQARDIPAGMYAAWGNAYFHPLQTYVATVTCGTDAFSFYCNPTVDDLFQQASTTVDSDEHERILQDLEQELYDDPPFIFLYAQEDLYGTSTRLNWEPRADELIFMYGASVNG